MSDLPLNQRLLLNSTEAGALCGVERHMIAKWCRQGLPYKPNGKKGRLIYRPELESWIKSKLIRTDEDLRRAMDRRRK